MAGPRVVASLMVVVGTRVVTSSRVAEGLKVVTGPKEVVSTGVPSDRIVVGGK